MTWRSWEALLLSRSFPWISGKSSIISITFLTSRPAGQNRSGKSDNPTPQKIAPPKQIKTGNLKKLGTLICKYHLYHPGNRFETFWGCDRSDRSSGLETQYSQSISLMIWCCSKFLNHQSSLPGWWYTYPSEKWWSSAVGIMTFPSLPSNSIESTHSTILKHIHAPPWPCLPKIVTTIPIFS